MADIDFIVFGPGRSGTTAFAKAFNLHPDIFCAVEYLGLREAHSGLALPEALLELRPIDRHKHQRSRDILKAKLQQDVLPRFYGNKLPRYYFQLAKLAHENPALHFFYIYRSPSAFVHSWDARAARPNDPGWPAGLRGIYGIMEQILCLKRLAALPAQATMVSYDALFYQDRELMARVAERIGAAPERFNQAEFEATLFNRSPRKNLRDDVYDAILERFRFDLIEDYFRENRLTTNTDPAFVDTVSRQFQTLPSPSEFLNWLRQLGPVTVDYLDTWHKQARNQIDNLEEEPCQWFHRYVTKARVLLAKDRQAAAAPEPPSEEGPAAA